MKARKGYTLMELVLVIAIIVIFAGLSYPTVMGMYGQYRLRAGADAVRAGWVGARAHAVEEGRRYRFSVVPGKGNFRVAPDSPEFWTGSTPEFDPDNPFLVQEDTLPQGIVFTIGNNNAPAADTGDSSMPVGNVDAGMWQSVAVFEADGTAQEDTTITLSYRSEGSRPLVINLRALTAISTAKMAPLEGQR